MSTGVIYGLKDPRTPWRIRYVGQTTNVMTRLHSHLCCYDKGPNKSKALRIWFADMKQVGVRPIMEALEYVAKSELNRAEREWMAFYDLFFPLANAPSTFQKLNHKQSTNH